MDGVKFLLELVDRMSGPATKVADALRSVHSELDSVQKLASKPLKLVVQASGEAAAKAARGPRAPVFGPGRGEAAKAARFREQAAAKSARESARVVAQLARQEERDRQISARDSARVVKALAREEGRERANAARLAERQLRAQTRAQEQAAREAERFAVGYHFKQLQRAKAIQDAREEAARLIGGGPSAGRQLLESLGGGGAVSAVSRMKELGEQFQAVTGFGPRAAVGIAAVGAAALLAAAGAYKLVTVIGDLVISGAGLAIAAAEAKGDTLDMLEAMLGTQHAAESVFHQLEGMTQTLAVSQHGVEASAQALAAAGVENKDQLVQAVKAIAQVDSVIKGAGGKIQSIIERATAAGKFKVEARKLTGTGVQIQKLVEEIARRTGKGAKEVEKQLAAGKIAAEVGISALTAVIDKKFGELAKKQALDFPAQLQRLRDNFTKLFDNVDTGPFLEAFSRIVELFSEGTTTGHALKEVLTAAFNGVFRVITAVEPYAKTFLKGLVIIALQVAIAFKPLIKNIREAFGGDQQKGPLDLAKTMSAVGVVLGGLIGAFVAAMPDIRAFITTVQIIAYPFKQMALGIAGVVALLGALTVAAGLAITWLVSLGTKAFDAGKGVVGGLIGGIKQGAGKLIDSVKTMGTQALAAFKGVFGIASPSKVMMQMGGHLSTGLALGIQRTAPVANDNMRDMLAVPPPRVRGDGVRGGGPTIQLTVQKGAFEINGVQGAADLEERMPELMSDALEMAALTLGGNTRAA